MSEAKTYLHNGRMYGRLQSDKETSDQLRHLRKLFTETGFSPIYYIDSFNVVRIRFNGTFLPWKEVEKYIPELRMANAA